MAGDWIKVEVATLDKPETLRMAELLGVDADKMCGILLRFWTWLDRSTGNGVVTHTSRIGVDQVMRCPGFAAALEAVGWGVFDENAVTLTLPNYDRHNGKPAKTRALGRDRKREYDERKSNADCVTREEKRREEITPKSKALARVPLAEPAEEHRELARGLGVDCEAEFRKYRDHFAAKGSRHKDEVAGFRNWLRRAAEYAQTRPAPGRRAATAAAMYGGTPREIDVTPIVTEVKRVA